jgi:hypothetical protein
VAALSSLLAYLNSGYSGQAADESTIAHFGGDDLLTAAKQYDPNAHWETVTNGDGGSGRTLVVDIEKLPSSKAGKAGYDLRGSNHKEREYLRNPSQVVNDDVYGSVTNSKNFADDREATWTKLAPLFVSLVAPMGAAALAAQGIGGAAGLTSAATGSGLTGVNSLGLPQWATQAIGKAPNIARQVGATGKLDLQSLLSQFLPGAAGSAGINPALVKGALTLADFARIRR